jgi:hypothetical protein
MRHPQKGDLAGLATFLPIKKRLVFVYELHANALHASFDLLAKMAIIGQGHPLLSLKFEQLSNCILTYRAYQTQTQAQWYEKAEILPNSCISIVLIPALPII